MLPASIRPLVEVSVWRRGSERAPHKPLLLLIALAELRGVGKRWLHFNQLEKRFKGFAELFGLSGGSLRLHYPFWRLQNDGDFWEVADRDRVMELIGGEPASGDVPVSVLRAVNARGGLSDDVLELLRSSPELVDELTVEILHQHFDPAMHGPVLEAVGMPGLRQSFREKR